MSSNANIISVERGSYSRGPVGFHSSIPAFCRAARLSSEVPASRVPPQPGLPSPGSNSAGSGALLGTQRMLSHSFDDSPMRTPCSRISSQGLAAITVESVSSCTCDAGTPPPAESKRMVASPMDLSTTMLSSKSLMVSDRFSILSVSSSQANWKISEKSGFPPSCLSVSISLTSLTPSLTKHLSPEAMLGHLARVTSTSRAPSLRV
mmetsp:Transcript_20128/g.61218  ORF Transcript_20128/g.61218 Transcript_20128/m.61218 type:complete len:206 (-) Transcript_20128:1360-1977(-)|eukprot:scaffold190160_cov26-Tisochrysis_lutea.AAC.3